MRQHLALALLATTTLIACGNKGALTFPPVLAAPIEAAGKTSPEAKTTASTPAAATAKDSNMPVSPAQ